MAVAVRQWLRRERFKRPRTIVFSLEGGQVWASWPGTRGTVKLGDEAEVTEMMRDFLAQTALGKRLTADE